MADIEDRSSISEGNDVKHPNQISKWQDLLKKLNDIQPTDSDKTILNDVAKQFAQQIKLDNGILQNSPDIDVSDCCMYCPVWGSQYDKALGICSIIAKSIFLTDEEAAEFDETEEKKLWKIYSKLITSLRQHHKKQKADNKIMVEKYRKIVSSKNRHMFEEMEKLPISRAILHPTPADIDIADSKDFEEVLNYIRSKPEKKLDVPYIRFKRGIVFSNGRLDLCAQGMTIDTLIDLLDAISDNELYPHILIANNPFGDDGAKLIAKFIKSDRTRVKTWYLCGCNITDVGIKYITDALSEKNIYPVESFWLKRNPLGVKGIKHIADMMKNNNTIRVLDIFNVAMMDEGCEYLFNALKSNTTLEVLYVGANGITSTGSKAVTEYFNHLIQQHQLGLKSLFIDVNRLSDVGIVSLIPAIKRYGKLKGLSLGANRITSVGMKVIADTFENDTILEYLDIGMCKATSNVRELPNNIKDDGVEFVVRLIKSCPSLKFLNLRHIGLSNDGLKAVTDAVIENRHLIKIFPEQSGCDDVTKYTKICQNITDENLKVYVSQTRFMNTDPRDLVKMCCHGELIMNAESLYLANM